MTRFEEQTALVTGGTRGIGRAIAARLADDGARVFLTGTDAAGAEAAAGEIDAYRGRVTGLPLDLADPASVEAAFAEVLRAAGGLHILVNNAGITRDGLLARLSAEDWSAVLRVNLDGLYACAAASAKWMNRSIFRASRRSR